MVEPECVCAATGGDRARADRRCTVRRRSGTGARAALEQSGLVGAEKLPCHRICTRAVPGGGFQYHEHSAFCAAWTAELHHNEFQQHQQHDEQQWEQRRPDAAICAEAVLLIGSPLILCGAAERWLRRFGIN